MNADPKKPRAGLLWSSLSCFASAGVMGFIFSDYGFSGALGIASFSIGVTSLVLGLGLFALWNKGGPS